MIRQKSKDPLTNKGVIKMDAKEYLHSDEMNDWDTIFDEPVKCEYTEEQLIRFAEIWALKKMGEMLDRLTDELTD